MTKAKKSIAGFKLREGNAIGAKVTLRGERMWEFFDRLITLAIPRIRDFRGLDPDGFDGGGNYSFGVTEQLIFPEIDYDKVDNIRGMNITIVTTARTNEEGKALLDAFGFPFRRPGATLGRGTNQWPRPRSSRSSSASRSSRCAATRAATAAADRRRCTAASACAGSASERWPTPARCRASRKLPGR